MKNITREEDRLVGRGEVGTWPWVSGTRLGGRHSSGKEENNENKPPPSNLCSLSVKGQGGQKTKAGQANDLKTLMRSRSEQQICILRNRKRKRMGLSQQLSHP